MENSEAKIREFNIDLDDENLRPKLLEMVRQIRPEWQAIDDSSIATIDFNGGITNKIVACFLKEHGVNTCATILFRIYGKNTEKFISREEELVYMNLMKRNDLGPQLYCKFRNGMSYEYIGF